MQRQITIALLAVAMVMMSGCFHSNHITIFNRTDETVTVHILIQSTGSDWDYTVSVEVEPRQGEQLPGKVRIDWPLPQSAPFLVRVASSFSDEIVEIEKESNPGTLLIIISYFTGLDVDFLV